MCIHLTKLRVIYADTDNMGVVYYANYFKWFEIGRTEMLRDLGMTYKSLEDRGLFLPVSEAQCKYMAPARYDERLIIETGYDFSLKAAVKFDYRILNEPGDVVHAVGFTKHACMDQNGKVVRLPKSIRDVFVKFAAEADGKIPKETEC